MCVNLVIYKDWYLTFRKEHRQMEFENRMLRKKFEPQRDEVTGE
jgi:hypothetical protein